MNRTRHTATSEPTPRAGRPPRLLEQVRDAVRARHYSHRTEKTYQMWIRRFILFHKKRHPSQIDLLPKI